MHGLWVDGFNFIFFLYLHNRAVDSILSGVRCYYCCCCLLLWLVVLWYLFIKNGSWLTDCERGKIVECLWTLARAPLEKSLKQNIYLSICIYIYIDTNTHWIMTNQPMVLIIIFFSLFVVVEFFFFFFFIYFLLASSVCVCVQIEDVIDRDIYTFIYLCVHKFSMGPVQTDRDDGRVSGGER